MPTVTVWIDINAPLLRVWEAVANLSDHGSWMADVESIAFDGAQTEGVGTIMKVATRIGPLRTTDLMTVTVWELKRLIGVEHQGLITGTGELRLDPVGGATRLTWNERLHFPWQFGGPIGAWTARPLFTWIWRRNLRALKRQVEARL
jgi:carbon monoxide dehydrogenase subunit G